jgi:hypothetical protein
LTDLLSGIDPKYMVDSSTYYVSESMVKGIHLSGELYTHHKKDKKCSKDPFLAVLPKGPQRKSLPYLIWLNSLII